MTFNPFLILLHRALRRLSRHVSASPDSRRNYRGAVRPGAGAAGRIRVAAPSAGAGLALILSLFMASPALSLVPVQGDKIFNSASFMTNESPLSGASATVTAVVCSPASIQFFKYSPLAGSTPVTIATTAYRTGSDPSSPFVAMPPPLSVGSTTPIDISKPVPLLPASMYHSGEPVFVQITAPDQNLDHTKADTILVTMSNTMTGDTEVIRLTETGADTGVFTGYIQTSEKTTFTMYDGSLSVSEGNSIKAVFSNALCNNIVSTTALVDPFGIVFDSSNGKPVDGVSVTLLDTSTGLPATVIGDDGVSSFPATVTSGGTATDSSGRHYDFPPGGYRFPFINPGNYKLQFTPPAGYRGPSTVPDATLQALPGGPFALVIPGSRQEQFTVNPGQVLRIDIPLDPSSTGLWLQKTAGKSTVAPGDFLPYELNVTNNSTTSVAAGIIITDIMPLGFHYQRGSTRINGLAAPDPAISPDGRTLIFAFGDLAANATGALRYVVEVSAGAQIGIAINTAVARAVSGTPSNQAQASVQVRSDFLSSKSIIMGQVIAGECGGIIDSDLLKGMEGVRIFLEDGTFVDTDKRGMFHIEGVRPGSHVVQLDLDSLPKDYQVVPCEENTRFAGTPYSQFVDVQGGTLWRADFHVARKARATVTQSVKGGASLELNSSLQGETISYHAELRGLNMQDSNTWLTVTLPEGVKYEKNSSQLDGKQLAEPEIADGTLTYRVGNRTGNWLDKLSFRAAVPGNGRTGELLTRALLSVEAPGGKVEQTPVAENVLRRVKSESRVSLPEIAVHTYFPTFGSTLDEKNRRTLDDFSVTLMSLIIEQITVTGRTDNVPIAQRSRALYPDNKALSLARAENVRQYLTDGLHLPSDKMTVAGRGDANPVADNRTAEGRALNRQVEIKVQADKVVDANRIEVVQEKSGVQKMLLQSLPPATAAADTEKGQEKPEKDAEGVHEKEGILSPCNGTVFAQPIHAVRICLVASLTPRLLLDGKEVPADRIGFTMKDNKTGKAIYTYIGIDFGKQGDHTLQLQGLDPFGNARFDQTIKITRSGEIAAIRLKSAEGNVADGRTPIRLHLELLDTAGQVIPAEADLEIRSGTLKSLKTASAIPEAVSNTAEQVHVDAAGNALFQPVNASGPYKAVLGFNKVTMEAETYVKPLLRDWILVGLGEGTVGYNTLSGNMVSLLQSGQEDHIYTDGRVAFYAKGQVKGEWLLTMAYDNAKGRGEAGNSLFQTIDPNTYYTLYGDASQQQYDAASARKIYLKIERDQFYAMFGDFDTGLTVTELSRYSRRMNGVKAEYQGKNLEANVFGAESGQSYARDEIRGDGTSGLYHLSRKNIVLNSDKITVETRDRFRSEIIVNSQAMGRYSDYSIDYVSGTIFFKAPVFSRDENFNPIYIVVEYETLDGGTESLTYGGRIGTKLLDQKLKAGVTYIHEGQVSGSGNSYGLDATYKLGAGTTLKAEVARTDTNFGGATREGNAYLAELGHNSASLISKLYFREQDSGFGLGQQNGSETGTRKFGVDAAYKLTDQLSLSGQAYRQYNLATSAVQDITEGKATYTSGPYSSHLGLRYASDRLGDGSNQTSEQLTMGASWLTLNKKLTLRADHDQSIGGNSNASFPTRTTFGADFQLTKKVTLFAQQELTYSTTTANTNTTRVGMKSTPWDGGTVNTSMERSLTNNSDRLFALFGLKQTWKITDKWSLDGGLDRSQTIKQAGFYQFNVNTPPASGSSENFTAVSLGTTYKENTWNVNSRIEVRSAQSEDKWGVVTSYVGEPREGWGWSSRLQLFDTKTSADGSTHINGDLRLGMVYRPLYTRWIILDRLDLLYDKQEGGTSVTMDSRRIVNNLSANFKPDKKTQISLLYGAKYVLESIDGTDYSGYTDMIGVEGRYDITPTWDVGLRGSALHSWNSGQINFSSGASVGYNVVQNAWISVGYNFTGFNDKDFSAANYTAKGPFIRFRFKFDQNSVHNAITCLTNI